jgi:phosphoserine phosphatase
LDAGPLREPAPDHVLTVVAPAPGGLDDAIVAAARAALNDLGAVVGAVQWLAPGEAVDLPFSGADAGRAEAAARRALAGRPLDLHAGAAAGRRRKLLVADMDATIVEGETLDELARRAGKLREIAAITARAMRGEMDFTQALEARVAMLEGLPEQALDDTLAGMRLMPGARALVRTMAENGAYTLLVSGGDRRFTGRAKALAGFDAERGNRFEVMDGRLTGRVGRPVVDRDAKRRALEETAREQAVPMALTLAIGDGANDLPMVEAAGLGIGYRPKPVLAAAAGARIEHADLRAALYFQGYQRDEFAG